MSNQSQTSSSKLNRVQLHLLELFSKDMDEQELTEIKELLVKYYQQKVDQELAEIWERKGYTKESFQKATGNLHLRSKKRNFK